MRFWYCFIELWPKSMKIIVVVVCVNQHQNLQVSLRRVRLAYARYVGTRILNLLVAIARAESFGVWARAHLA